MPIFPKLLRAGAGPHDLGPGDNKGGTFPELAAQYNPEHTEGDDQDLGRQSVPTAEDTGSGSDTVARNPLYVWLLLSPSVSALNFASRRNMTPGIPLQITYSR